MSEITITDRALLRIIDQLGLSAVVDRIAEQREPRSGWQIGLDLARRRVRELRQAGLIRQARINRENWRYWVLTDDGRLAAEAAPTPTELSSLARFQLAELAAAGAPGDVVAELTCAEHDQLERRAPPAPSGRRARARPHRLGPPA